MSVAVHLSPYFEPIGELNPLTLTDGSDYAAGFKDDSGKPWGLHVPVPAAVVELAVLKRAAFTIGLEPDGRFLLRSDGLSDIALESAATLGCLPVMRLPDLMSACLNPAELRREDCPVRALERLRNDLIEAAAMIETTLATLQTSR